MSQPFVKICCIKSVAEAGLAISAGASAIGLVSHMPSGPGVISEDLIAEIARSIPPAVSSFLLTQQQTASEIIQQHRICKTAAIQMVDAVPTDELHELRRTLPSVKLVQVVHVVDAASIMAAQFVAPFADAVLLDSGQPTAAIKMLSGTGCTHDWTLSREICHALQVPVFWLAAFQRTTSCKRLQRPIRLALICAVVCALMTILTKRNCALSSLPFVR